MKGLQNSYYPTSAEYHKMHGDLTVFTKGLYPIERNVMKFLLAQLNGGDFSTLTERILVANAAQWRKELHQVGR